MTTKVKQRRKELARAKRIRQEKVIPTATVRELKTEFTMMNAPKDYTNESEK